ncbi:hypothetical protein ACQ4PT_041889 [Festuca glaucescens]
MPRFNDEDEVDLPIPGGPQLGEFVAHALQAKSRQAFVPGGRGSRFPVGLPAISPSAPPGRPKALSASFARHVHQSVGSNDSDFAASSLGIKCELVEKARRGLFDNVVLEELPRHGGDAVIQKETEVAEFVHHNADFPTLARVSRAPACMTPIRPSDFRSGSFSSPCWSLGEARVMIGANACPLPMVCSVVKPIQVTVMADNMLSCELDAVCVGPGDSPLGPWAVSAAWEDIPKDIPTGWFCLPKGYLDLRLGFVANRKEILKFGWQARRIKIPTTPVSLVRSFASVVEGVGMNRGRDTFGAGNPLRDDSRKRGPDRSRGDDRDWDEQERRRREDAWLEGDLHSKLERSYDPDRREQGYGRQSDFGGDRDRDGFMYDSRGEFGGERFHEGGDVRRHRSPYGRRDDFQRRPPPQGPPPKGIKCFKCGDEGHYLASCTNKLIWYTCKKEGHVTMNCPNLKSKELKIYGFGIPGQGFYALDVDVVAKLTGVKGTGAIIKILAGNHSVKIVEEELKYWVEEKWQ